jgi:hypothetical protein
MLIRLYALTASFNNFQITQKTFPEVGINSINGDDGLKPPGSFSGFQKNQQPITQY